MDTFKGQDNDVAANLCGDNNYAIVKVPHNLTNKFQPIESTTNSLQLNKGKNSAVSM